MATTLRRHDLLRPGPGAWDAALRSDRELASVPLLAEWARRGWPVIVRRPTDGDGSDDVSAGVPLPPSHGKRRIALRFPPGAPLAAQPPVTLREAAAAASDAWQPVIAALVELGERGGAAPCVFGALLWEHVTGLPYLTEASDLDLLWHVADAAMVEPLTAALLRLDALGPVRIDGEIVLPDGAGLNWRECARADGPAATVLAKTMAGVETRPRSDLFGIRAQAR